MDTDKFVGVIKSFSNLIDLHRRQDKLLRKMAIAIANKHLEQNEERQTINENASTQSALDLMLYNKPYNPGPRRHFSRVNYPTHLRVHDLRAVRVVEVPDENPSAFWVLDTLEHKPRVAVTREVLDAEYLLLRPPHNKK